MQTGTLDALLYQATVAIDAIRERATRPPTRRQLRALERLNRAILTLADATHD